MNSKQNSSNTHKGQIKFLNLYGDITIEWEDKDHIEMLKVIEEKLEQGFQFYIVKDRFCGLPFTGGKKEVKRISQVEGNKVHIKDEAISKYFSNITSATIVNDNTQSHQVVKNSRDANEIAKSSSVCTKAPTRG